MNFLKLFLASIAVVSLLGSPAFAAPETKIAYVDIQKALADSQAGGKAKKAYEVEVKEAQKELNKKKSAFQAKGEAFKKQKSSLSREALASKQEELIQMEKDLKRNFQDLEQKLRRRNGQIIAGLIKELRKAVQVVGEKNGYTMIVERGSDAVLYVNSANDITAEVVQAFDEQSN